MQKKIEVELLPYTCSHCGNNEWILHVGHTSNGKTLLTTTCATPGCVEGRKKSMDVGENDWIFWDEFDITGQGHDETDHGHKIGYFN
jgi:hypothetical protein